MDMIELLSAMVVNQASDLFISYDSPPLIKVEGKTRPLSDSRLTAEQNHKLIYSILNEQNVAEFKANHELNIALKLEKVGRFRVNVFQQSGEPAMVVRHIKKKIPTIEELGLPPVLKELICQERGLILLVGSTGTGKSTTLASMIDHRNSHYGGHILTIEDPIEFIHKNKKSLVNQREVGVDTESFEIALKNAMREAPDVILIGEIRDKQTMKQAITYAETGHLCLATLHANSTSLALERIVNFFSEEAHQILLQDIALNLKAIVAQRLCAGIEEKRVAAVELMVCTPFISQLIEKGRIEDIREAMQRSKEQVNQVFDDALYDLVNKGAITRKEALRKADSENNLALKFRLEDGDKPKTIEADEQTFTIDEEAPFSQYKTFSIQAIKVIAKRSDTQKRLNHAIMFALNQHGLELKNNNADLLVQYVLAVKEEENLSLSDLDDKKSPKSFITAKKAQATLSFKVVDNTSQKAVFRISAVRPEAELNETQEQLNQAMAGLLQKLPLGREC